MRKHLGVCLDACHAAVEFENATASLDALSAAGIPLGKLQVTTGLSLESAGPAQLLELRRYADNVYLHQVVVQAGEQLVRYDDLLASNHHVDMYWFPHTDRMLVKRNNRTVDEPSPLSRTREVLEDRLAVVVLGATNSTTRFWDARHLFNWVVGRTLGVGMAFFITYGSYMPKEFPVPASAGAIALGDTAFAVVAGIVAWIAYLIANIVVGLRVTEEEEREGRQRRGRDDDRDDDRQRQHQHGEAFQEGAEDDVEHRADADAHEHEGARLRDDGGRYLVKEQAEGPSDHSAHEQARCKGAARSATANGEGCGQHLGQGNAEQ